MIGYGMVPVTIPYILYVDLHINRSCHVSGILFGKIGRVDHSDLLFGIIGSASDH